MPTPQQLASEISADPAGLGYGANDGTRDHSIAAKMNTKSLAGDIPLAEFYRACVLNGLMGKLKFAARRLAVKTGTAASPAAADLNAGIRADQGLSLLTADPASLPAVPIGDAGVVTIFQAYRDTDGYITGAQYTALAGLAANRRSRAEVLWGDGTVITAADVGGAR